MKRYILPLSVLLLTLFTVSLYYIRPPEGGHFPCTLKIEEGESAQSIAEKLYNNSLIRSKEAFLVFAKLSGVERFLQAGEYMFWKPASLFGIINKLHKGRVYLHKVTIPEGATIQQIAEILSREEVCRKERFILLCHDKEFARNLLGFEVRSLEGYLFAETYFFPKNLEEEIVIKSMVKRTKEVLAPYALRIRGMGLSVHQALTLASIIEKESSHDWEKSIISGVYHNRLRKGMRLEADPTLLYVLKKSRNLTYKDLRIDSPYNTYMYFGLPPGPICNPSLSSIHAALYPKNVPYLFFVSKGDGTHYFSTSFQDHVRAKLIFRRRWR